MSLLECRCRLRYPSGFLLDVAFAVDRGVTALFGPSGSGKTSVLSVIAGLRKPQEGHIGLGSRTLFDSSAGIWLAPERRRVGYVFQEPLLFPHLNVTRNLLYGWKRRPRGTRVIDFERVIQVLELDDLRARYPHTLSGGQRQRVSLARALLCSPEVLLLDEPLVSVDETLRGKVLEYVERILQEWHVQTVYVSHNAEEVRRLAQHVLVIRAGRIVCEGTPEAVLSRRAE